MEGGGRGSRREMVGFVQSPWTRSDGCHSTSPAAEISASARAAVLHGSAIRFTSFGRSADGTFVLGAVPRVGGGCWHHGRVKSCWWTGCTRTAGTRECPGHDHPEPVGERGLHAPADPGDHVRADDGDVSGRARPDDRVDGAADYRRDGAVILPLLQSGV